MKRSSKMSAGASGSDRGRAGAVEPPNQQQQGSALCTVPVWVAFLAHQRKSLLATGFRRPSPRRGGNDTTPIALDNHDQTNPSPLIRRIKPAPDPAKP